MNVFTTDHPLTEQESWFEAKAHPLLRAAGWAFVTALILTPLAALAICERIIGERGPDPDPGPELLLPWIGAVVFVTSFVLVFALLSAWRWVAGAARPS